MKNIICHLIFLFVSVSVRITNKQLDNDSEHVVLGTPGRLQFCNITDLEDGEFLVISCLISLKSLAVNLQGLLSTGFLRPC